MVLLATLCAACADPPLEPDTPFGVSFSHSILDKGWNVETFRHECLYTVSAEASGGPEGAFAVWDSGDLEILCVNEPAVTSDPQPVNILDGVAAERITVTLSSGETATTKAAGEYTISGLPLGAYRVTVPGQLGDVVFATISEIAVLITPDQVVIHNFGGIRQ